MTDTTYWPPQSKNSPNPDFNPPPTTGSNAIPPAAKSSAIRKCPFRKKYYAVYKINRKDGTTFYRRDFFYCDDLVDHIEDEFQNCIGKECALWTPLGCGCK